MSGRQDRFSGNILLYHYLSTKRNRIFLNRSITRALKVHKYILGNGSTHGFPGSDHESRSEWKLPSLDALDDMVEQEKSKGSFVLDVHGFKTLPTGKVLARNKIARKSRNLFSVQSTVQISIIAESSILPCNSPPPQKAIVKGVESDHGRRADAETDRIVIKPDDLSISPYRRSLSLDTSYKMILSVNFSSQTDAENLYKHLGSDAANPEIHTRLSASFPNILECPTGTTILPLKDNKRRLDFGVEVSMHWIDTLAESILAAHNQQLKNSARPTSYPTPPLNVDDPKYEITYVYANEVLKRFSLLCPHGGCQKRKPADIDDLRMHLDSWHDYFRYQAIEEGVDDEGVMRWRFECEVADHKADRRSSRRADEPFDVRITAPAQPFNQRRYLSEANDDYQKMSRLERTAKHKMPKPAVVVPLKRHRLPEEVQERPARKKKTFSVPKAPPGVTFFRACSRRPFKEGEDVSESDDDVECNWIDLRKIAEDNKNSNLSDSARGFLKIFDKFMQEENAQSHIHAGDALVRFARQKGACLWHDELLGEFTAKIEELTKDEVISEEIYAGCLRIVHSQKPTVQVGNELSQRLAELDVTTSSVASSPSKERAGEAAKGAKSRKGKGKAKVTDTGHLTPITADSDGDIEMREAALNSLLVVEAKPQAEQADAPFGQCVCGVDALTCPGTSPIIACKGMDCIRRYFHLDCIKENLMSLGGVLGQNRRDWACDDCKGISDTAI
ncbi:hypothetical protein BKA66DRAFT_423378 [Pyrenochaeta sp. MPI-SDFR-AT-0127]|nr:hypothetical protein BKA66DRAFT_423378 [Pyrenochaeta sp. MPI-SDFR-AT-0127]